ncbi:MAG: class B sortase [Clostridia bacterium]|nr:class B sortase [Clostridia bacterium]
MNGDPRDPRYYRPQSGSYQPQPPVQQPRYLAPQAQDDAPAPPAQRVRQPRSQRPPQPSRAGGQQGYRPTRQKPRKQTIIWSRLLLVILCVGVMVYAASQLILYAIGSINTHRNNAALQAMYVSHTEAPTQQPTATPDPTPTPVPTAAPAVVARVTPTPTAAPRLKDEYQFIGKTTRKELQELWGINHDLVGWLNIPGVVDLPVVYRDNDYYLKRDFYKNRSNAGTLFLDVNHPLRAENQYLVIHGHNMKDGSMFGLLAHYEDRDYAAKHPTIYWSTLYREETYKVFAVLVVPTDVTDPHFVPYLGTPKFSSIAHFNSFIDQVRKNAKYITSEKVTHEDALLTLSTCLDDDRIVVLCKRTSH